MVWAWRGETHRHRSQTIDIRLTGRPPMMSSLLFPSRCSLWFFCSSRPLGLFSYLSLDLLGHLSTLDDLTKAYKRREETQGKMTIAPAQHVPPRRPSDLAPMHSPSFTDSAVAEDSLSSSPSSSSSHPSTSSSDTSPVIAIHPTLCAPVDPKTRQQLLKKQQDLAKDDPVAGGVEGDEGGAAMTHQPSETDFGYRRSFGDRMKDKWRKVRGGKERSRSRSKKRKDVRRDITVLSSEA